MKPPQGTPFLARDSYRMRRLMDAARFLPVLGLILLLLPLMRLDPQAETPPTAAESVYLFLVWFVLVVVAFLMSLWLRKTLVPPHGPVVPQDRRAEQIDTLLSGAERHFPHASVREDMAERQPGAGQSAAPPSAPRPAPRGDD